jgi:hypothetical protein
MPDRPIGHGGPRRVLASLAPLAIAALVALPGLGLAARVPRRAAAANPYTDIAKVSALARTAILTDLRLGIMGGTSRDTFDPSGLVARDVAVRLIVHALVASHALAAFPTAHSPLPYKDVAEGSPYDPTLALALKLGILPAAPTGSTFDPTANLTRVPRSSQRPRRRPIRIATSATSPRPRATRSSPPRPSASCHRPQNTPGTRTATSPGPNSRSPSTACTHSSPPRCRPRSP